MTIRAFQMRVSFGFVWRYGYFATGCPWICMKIYVNPRKPFGFVWKYAYFTKG